MLREVSDIGYIKKNRTPKEEAELRKHLKREDAEIRRQEQQHIDHANGTKIQIKGSQKR